MPYAFNEQIRIYYEVESSGPPLVLAHGLGCSLQDWRDTGWVEALGNRFQLILVDARGHGRSSKPYDPEAYRPIHQAKDQIAVLDDLGVDKAHFLGWSMGGNAGLAVGIYAPDRCLSIMMGGTQPFARDERMSQPDLPTPIPFAGMPDGPNPIERMLAQGGETWVAFYEGNMVVPPGMKRRLMANDFEAVGARFQGIHQKNIVQYLGPVQMPCLVFVGEDEAAYGGAKQLADLLPHAEFVAYPGLNHFDMFTRIDVVLPNILRFLDNNA